MFTVIQILIIIFACFALSRAIIRLKKRDLNAFSVFFWLIIWLSVIVVAFFPSIPLDIAAFLGISSGTGLLVYISILTLFYLVYRLYVFVQGQEQKITQLTRELALRGAKK